MGLREVMRELHWSPAEKKIARAAYDAGRERLLAETVAAFKARAAAVNTIEEMWAVQDFLQTREGDINHLLDYRYSQLPSVLGRMVGRGLLDESAVTALGEEKLAIIREVAAMVSKHGD